MDGEDPLLAKVLLFLACGWPNAVDEELKPFNHWREEKVFNKVVFYGVPGSLFLLRGERKC